MEVLALDRKRLRRAGSDVESTAASTLSASTAAYDPAWASPPVRRRTTSLVRLAGQTLALLLLLAAGLTLSGYVVNLPAGVPVLPFPPWRHRTRPSSPPARTASATYAGIYTPATAFPTSVFASMYRTPQGTTVQPRPAIPNLVTSGAAAGFFPDAVAHPSIFPTGDKAEHAVLPLPSSTASAGAPSEEDQVRYTFRRINRLIAQGGDPCARCQAALRQGRKLARLHPARVPDVLADLCITHQAKNMWGPGKNFVSLPEAEMACRRTYAASTLGGSYAQVLSYARLSDEDSLDGQAICARFLHACPAPAPQVLNQTWLDQWFIAAGASPSVPARVAAREAERAERHAARLALGRQQTVQVAHLSDIHLDPRYMPQTEGACTSGQCCRVGSSNSSSTTTGPHPVEPAGYYGAYKCDSPWSLFLATMEAVPGILPRGQQLELSLFTGDAVTHENAKPWQLTRDLLFYTQQAVSDVLKRYLSPGPVYSAIGNHDSVPSDFVPLGDLPDGRREAVQWEWDNVARLLQSEGWVTRHHELEQVRRHQGGYSVLHRPKNVDLDQPGLRIVVLNTDAWYRANPFAYIASTAVDGSGMLRFLTEVLAQAEQRGEKVWLVGHVLPAWSGTNTLDNPSQLAHAILDRFSQSRTLVGSFFGHTHEDQFSVLYPFPQPQAEAAPGMKADHAGLNNSTAHLARGAMLMAPSITPGSNVNPAFRVYDVDEHTWEVLDYTQFYAQLADVSYNETARQTGEQPPLVWRKLYSAYEQFGSFPASLQRGTYSAPVALKGDRWPHGAPLNGTFWAAVTDEMRANMTLVTEHTRLSGRLSPRSPRCTTQACQEAKICYMRAGDAVEGQACPQGFDSVQSGPDSYH